VIREKFLDGMSRAAATVSVVTTDGPAGRAGVTVSAMSSVSADSAAPSLLVCVHRLSPAAPAILTNGVFCVNVLKDSQAWISDVFAGRFKTEAGDKFSAGEWTTLRTGAPALVEALVAFDCTLRLATLYGSHYIVVGDLEDAVVSDAGPALIYANRAYGASVSLGAVPRLRRAPGSASATSVVVGCLPSLAPYAGPRLLAEFVDHHDDVGVGLAEGDQDELIAWLGSGEVAFALSYDLGLTPAVRAEPLAQVPPYVLLPAHHPLADAATVSLAALVDEPLVLLDLPPAREHALEVFAAHRLTPNVAHRSPSFETVRSLVGNALGYAVLATKPASAVTYDGRAVVALPITEPVPATRLALLTAAGRRLRPEAEALLNLFRMRLGPEPRPSRRPVGPGSR
jgi:flavin reductase (DIM6/NTAB) family NADH-FMN oxidoreductase RutF